MTMIDSKVDGQEISIDAQNRAITEIKNTVGDIVSTAAQFEADVRDAMASITALEPGYTLVSNETGRAEPSIITKDELECLSGLTSSVQGHINNLSNGINNAAAAAAAKQDAITGAATTITSANLVASRAVISNLNGKIAISAVTDAQLAQCANTASKTAKGFAQWANALSNIAETRPAVVVEAWRDGKNWYRKWSDGRIEQGGYIQSTVHGLYINLHIPMSDVNYSISITRSRTGSSTSELSYSIGILEDYTTTTAFRVQSLVSGTVERVIWKVTGY